MGTASSAMQASTADSIQSSVGCWHFISNKIRTALPQKRSARENNEDVAVQGGEELCRLQEHLPDDRFGESVVRGRREAHSGEGLTKTVAKISQLKASYDLIKRRIQEPSTIGKGVYYKIFVISPELQHSFGFNHIVNVVCSQISSTMKTASRKRHCTVVKCVDSSVDTPKSSTNLSRWL